VLVKKNEDNFNHQIRHESACPSEVLFVKIHQPRNTKTIRNNKATQITTSENLLRSLHRIFEVSVVLGKPFETEEATQRITKHITCEFL